jgi:hypothetical protein
MSIAFLITSVLALYAVSKRLIFLLIAIISWIGTVQESLISKYTKNAKCIAAVSEQLQTIN